MGGKGSKKETVTTTNSPKPKKNGESRIEDSANGEKRESSSITNEEDEIHPSWNDEELFNRDKKKVCKDDFELLTVIGKGSFGKVMQVKKKKTTERFSQ